MPVFGTVSKRNLAKAHPKLKLILNEAIKVIDFKVLDSTRGRALQTKAFLTGHSKARFGQSAHNFVPSIAVDLFPAPYDWNDVDAFRKLYDVIGSYNAETGQGKGLAKQLKIPIRCGIDWNMDGDKTKNDAWDGGHYELHPWREFAKTAKLVED